MERQREQTPLSVLKQYWGYPDFRDPQAHIIAAVLDGHDTLALLPTGGGKSICFQVPGLCLEGLTLVISPLIALMKDQVERLNSLGIPATYVNSSLGFRQIDRRLQAAMDGEYKFLYLAPERLQSDMFQLRLPHMQVSLIAVDEAHCISQWGYDFRPAYLQIASLRTFLPKVPIIALTASATPKVQEDMVEKLALHQPRRFSKSFRRDNLRYFVLPEENVQDRILTIARRTQGTGIVYARTRRATETMARKLVEVGLSAHAYHGGMKTSERNRIQEAWLSNEYRIIVATNAFGMGIDKPDVRFVVHYHLPMDLESYYQEAGRGGRDGQAALAIAFHHPSDIAEIKRWSAEKYPDWRQLAKHYKALCDFYRIPNMGEVDLVVGLDMAGLSKAAQSPALALYHSLRIFHNEGLLALHEDSDDYAYVQVIAAPTDILLFKNQHPQLADFIDFLLRTLGGEVFNQAVRFFPDQWVRRLGINIQTLDLHLQRLAQYQLIEYVPATSEPTIRFFKPKHTLTKAEVNWPKYQFLREQQAIRLRELLRYVEGNKVCRSLIIQHYFGEQAHQPCGRCDVCIGRHKVKLNDQAFKQLMGAMMTYIREKDPTYRQVLHELPHGSPSQREKVLRYLLDKKIVLAGPAGELTIPSR